MSDFLVNQLRQACPGGLAPVGLLWWACSGGLALVDLLALRASKASQREAFHLALRCKRKTPPGRGQRPENGDRRRRCGRDAARRRPRWRFPVIGQRNFQNRPPENKDGTGAVGLASRGSCPAEDGEAPDSGRRSAPSTTNTRTAQRTVPTTKTKNPAGEPAGW